MTVGSDEFEILVFILRHSGRPIPRDAWRSLWPGQSHASCVTARRVVTNHSSNLRSIAPSRSHAKPLRQRGESADLLVTQHEPPLKLHRDRVRPKGYRSLVEWLAGKDGPPYFAGGRPEESPDGKPVLTHMVSPEPQAAFAFCETRGEEVSQRLRAVPLARAWDLFTYCMRSTSVRSWLMEPGSTRGWRKRQAPGSMAAGHIRSSRAAL